MPAPAVGVLLTSRSHALTRQQSTLAAARHDGHRLAWAGVLVAVLVAALAAATVRWGSPISIAHRAHHSFLAPPVRSVDLNKRLFTLSSSGRVDLWKVAWREARSAPVVGDGAGSYDRYWRLHRPNSATVQDAHNLYLETLAELGAVGLVLLLVVLATPLVTAVRARRSPLVPAAAAAFCAYLAHCVVDWDWELEGVTLAALLCGLACLLALRDGGEPPLGARVRVAAVAVAAALSVAAVLALLGNTAIESSDAAARSANWRSAASHAHAAIRWMPWSTAGLQRLGEAQSGLRQYAAARATLRRAIRRDPGNWVLWLDLAGASSGAEQQAAFRQVQRLNPKDPSLGEYMAVVVRP